VTWRTGRAAPFELPPPAAHNGRVAIPTFREVQDDITAQLREQGFLAAILVDLGPLAHIERSFGGAAFRALRSQVDPLLEDMRERFRQDDFVTRDEREGDRFLLFLSGPRRGDTPFRAENLRKLAERVEEFLNPRVGRLTLPYLKERPVLVAGYGVVLWSPLESPERQVLRLVDDAAACAEMRARLRERDQRERLFEIIHNREIWTAFQPIVDLASGDVMGWEGLSRGPRGSELEPPIVLFGRAARHGLTEELERACRRQAFVDWRALAQSGRLFLNTVPATVRDTSFQGRGVLDYLGPDIAPSGVTLEITERQVIENLNLYREAMHAFTDLGFSFAIDDVGAGYSGLETVAVLKPSYLKIDIALVRDVHQKKVSQQVVKAILDMGEGLGARVIAEGIQAREEADALRGIGVPWGQGYFYARPIDPYAAQPVEPAP
jgi:EAL domain-containing protein (putative c-di-GMP-specific phosphodiesterase class I)